MSRPRQTLILKQRRMAVDFPVDNWYDHTWWVREVEAKTESIYLMIYTEDQTSLSCDHMIRPLKSCLSFSVFLCVAGQACWREWGGGGNSYDRKKVWSSIYNSILYGLRQKLVVRERDPVMTNGVALYIIAFAVMRYNNKEQGSALAASLTSAVCLFKGTLRWKSNCLFLVEFFTCMGIVSFYRDRVVKVN